jgi:serine/threonine-protein kinase
VDTDRNLLFGVLALQLEYIDPQRFTEACAAWAVSNQKTLPEILIDRGWMKGREVEEVERFLDRKLKRHKGDVEKTLASESPQEIQQVIRAARNKEDPEATTEMSSGLSGDPSPQPETNASRGTNPDGPTEFYTPSAAGYVPMETVNYEPEELRSRYTLTKMHGEGGIGRVWLAHDQHLNRQVALKEIRPDKEQNKIALRRFVKEAQITSQLEHPNIVPVYELTSSKEESRSFYTMRFVRGDTLRSAIDRYHRKRREGTATAIELRELLNSFVLVCHAMGYAHSRGVLHRDLKPSNIMVGSFGEVIVLDWGLAKMVDHDDEDDDDLLAAGPISVTEEADTLVTQQGAVLGTLPYMAPEQAAGRVDKINVRTDIYGLGAILYAVLTGNHPHHGTSTKDIRSQILNKPTPRARAEATHIHPALDAICAKAMAKRRKERYESPTALAEDVRRWLADEMVSVYRDPFVSRVGRWLRRHRTWARSIAATLLIVTAISCIASVFIQGALTREERAHLATAEAKEQRERALAAETIAKEKTERALTAETKAKQETERALGAEQIAKAESVQRLRDARDVLETALTQMSRELRYYPGVAQLREMLLERAAAVYERYAARETDDPTLQADSGRAFLRLGQVYDLLEQHDKAIDAYKTAERVFTVLAEELPEYRLNIAQAKRKQSKPLRRLGNLDEAQVPVDDALRILDEMDASPDDIEAHVERAVCLLEGARLQDRRGEKQDAASTLQQVTTDLQSLASESSKPKHREFLAATYLAHGDVLRALGKSEDAITAVRGAIDVYRRLESEGLDHPDYFDYVEGRANSSINLANILRTTGRLAEEIQAYTDAINDYAVLVRRRPAIAQYRENLEITRISLAQLRQGLGENRESQLLADQAIRGFTDLLNNHPPSPRYHEGRAVAAIALGRALFNLDDHETAHRQFLGAIQIYQGILAPHYPDEFAYFRGLGVAQSNLGRLLHKQGNLADAKPVLEQSIASLENALSIQEDGATDHETLNSLAWAKTHYGDLLWEIGNQAGAKTAYSEARKIRIELPPDSEYLYNLAILLADCPDPESRNVAGAITLAKEATNQTPENPKYWNVLALSHYRDKNWKECQDALAEATKQRLSPHSPHAADLLIAAMAHWHQDDEDTAKAELEEARKTEFMAQNRGNLDLQRLLAEAEALIEQ